MYPFVIRLVDRALQNSVLQPVRIKIDPGSINTGVAIVREDGKNKQFSHSWKFAIVGAQSVKH